MADFKELFVGFAVVGIFVLAMISFGIDLQTKNGVEDGLLTDPLLNKTYSNLNDNLGQFDESSNGSLNSFELETPTVGFGSLIITSIVSIGKTFRVMISGVYNVLMVLPAQMLGVSPIVIGVLNAILAVLMIIGLWRLYKLGG